MSRNANGQASVRVILPLAALGVVVLAAGAFALSGGSGSSAKKSADPVATSDAVPPSSESVASSSTTAKAAVTLPNNVSFGGGPAAANTGSVAAGDRGGAPVADPNATPGTRPGAPVTSGDAATSVAQAPPTNPPSQTTAPGTPQPGQSLGSKPVAQADTAVAVAGQPIVINVVANDSDPDGDLNPDSVILTSKPQAGTASLGKGGKVTYTADPSYQGPDFFSYVVCDRKNNCGGNMVSISVTISAAAGTTSSTDAPPPPPAGNS
jgi:hypothetical protein